MEPANGRPIVTLISGPNILSLHLVNFFLNKHCFVYIVSKETDRWKWFLKDNNLSLVNFLEVGQTPPLTHYLILIEGIDQANLLLTETQTNNLFEFINSNMSRMRGFVVLPYLTSKNIEKNMSHILSKFLEVKQNLNLVYMGELYGKFITYNTTFVSKSFLGVTNGKVKVPQVDHDCYPANVDDVVTKLTKALFSFGFEKKRVVIATKMSAFSFLRRLQEVAPFVIFERHDAYQKPVNVPLFDFEEAGEIDKASIKNTLEWLMANRNLYATSQAIKKQKKLPTVKIKVKLPKVNFSKFKAKKLSIPKIKNRSLALGVLVALWFLCLPFLSIFISALSLKGSVSLLMNGNRPAAQALVGISSLFSRIPAFYKIFSLPSINNILIRGNEIVSDGISSYELGVEIISGINSNEDYELENLSNNLFLKLDSIYNNISFLEADIKQMPQLLTFIPSVNFGEIRSLVLGGRDLVSSLPDLLGQNKKMTYLILFQNNMEIRPTGGFIGSFALASFEKGKLIDNSIYDVYSADGQLKGHIEPPAPIKNYLGEANWYLRDSNWDPDFARSAARAEWFLEKELDRSVDGVIAIDLEVVKEILKTTGPIKLPDLNETITDKNLYEKIQHEVESDFFPGSRKKANILTSLATEIMNKTQSDSNFHAKFSKTIFNLIEGRHIQAFFHDKKAQDAIDLLGMNGSLEDMCSGNCINLWTGEVEANVGVNKANYYVKRKMSFDVNVTKDIIDSNLNVMISNTATNNSSLAGVYKAYIRALAPLGSEFSKVVVRDVDGTKLVDPETVVVNGHAEAGVLVDIAPSATKTITFNWKQKNTANLDLPGKARIFVRKQGGTSNDGMNIHIRLPRSLTREAEFSYNTTDLSSDFEKEINW